MDTLSVFMEFRLVYKIREEFKFWRVIVNITYIIEYLLDCKMRIDQVRVILCGLN